MLTLRENIRGGDLSNQVTSAFMCFILCAHYYELLWGHILSQQGQSKYVYGLSAEIVSKTLEISLFSVGAV